jgi:hypothetical protein
VLVIGIGRRDEGYEQFLVIGRQSLSGDED